ncbi:MAG: hypothetical protein Kow00121_41590 [Elainellaceae cyanobacterium]
MSLSSFAAIAYGILAIVGGILGYAKAKSQPSLISGVVSGALLIIGGIAQQQGLVWGLWLSILVTGVLVVVFAIRLWKTRKWMPAGLMLAAGVVALIALLFA